MKDENQILYFGHDPIPNDVYEDYQNLEKLKRAINDAVEHYNEIDTEKKEAIKQLLLSMNKHFENMQPAKFNRPRQ